MIVLNEKGRRERPVPKPIKMDDFEAVMQKKPRAPNLKYYLQATCTADQYIAIVAKLLAAEKAGRKINWAGCNIDRACTWSTMPEGPDFWNALHYELEQKYHA